MAKKPASSFNCTCIDANLLDHRHMHSPTGSDRVHVFIVVPGSWMLICSIKTLFRSQLASLSSTPCSLPICLRVGGPALLSTRTDLCSLYSDVFCSTPVVYCSAAPSDDVSASPLCSGISILYNCPLSCWLLHEPTYLAMVTTLRFSSLVHRPSLVAAMPLLSCVLLPSPSAYRSLHIWPKA